tara:strand:+ start:229 stop:642 length:414 start_codon:yes stop_codon:yes gene_type:complete
MAHYNNLIVQDFVKETRTSGTVTSLTIKLNAYDGNNNMTEVTGDGGYLTHDDATFRPRTVNSKTYYDWDNCTPIASQSFTYTVPVSDQTNLTQDFEDHNDSEQTAYQEKRRAWSAVWRKSETCKNAFAALYAAVEAL